MGTPSELPNLTTKKQGVWATSHDYDRTLVNPDVNLHSLGMANFRGIYSTSLSLGNVMKNISKICKLKTNTETVCHATARMRFLINGTWISDGVAASAKKARVAAINNSLLYLIREKGFQVIAAEFVPPDAIMTITQEMLVRGPHGNVCATPGEADFEEVRRNVALFLREFLINPHMMKLQLDVTNLSPMLRQDIHNTANVTKVNHRNEGNFISCWKVNSTYHNLFERPMASLVKRVRFLSSF